MGAQESHSHVIPSAVLLAASQSTRSRAHSHRINRCAFLSHVPSCCNTPPPFIGSPRPVAKCLTLAEDSALVSASSTMSSSVGQYEPETERRALGADAVRVLVMLSSHITKMQPKEGELATIFMAYHVLFHQCPSVVFSMSTCPEFSLGITASTNHFNWLSALNSRLA